MSEDAWSDGTQIARRIRQKELSATEAVTAAIERIERVNPRINAVIITLFEEALRTASNASWEPGLLYGVPFLLKDLGPTQAGQPFYLGNKALMLADNRAKTDSVLGERFRRLGLMTIGKTNTSEMGAQTTTQPLSFGPTRNPWDPDQSPSGSSGGTAAAIAAGLVPIAHGNDGLGSIRLPAAWCGVIGCKPTRGLVPNGPASTNRMNHEFVLTRSVRDVAAVLDGVAGPALGELYSWRPPSVPFTSCLTQPASLRVGLLTRPPDGGSIEPVMANAVEEAGALLESLGHRVEYGHPAALFEDQSPSLQPDRPSDYRRRIRTIGEVLGRPATQDDVEPYLWAMASVEREETLDSYIAAVAWEQAWSARVQSWWKQFDLLVTPTVPMTAESLDSLIPPADKPELFFDRMKRHITFTAPFNITGQPAIALPWIQLDRREMMPASIQLVASTGSDDLILSVAWQIEHARPLFTKPRICA
jgi:amidase